MERLVWRLSALALVAGSLALSGRGALADDEDFEDFSAGLVGKYVAGQHDVRRVDEDVAFVWGNAVPDHRLPPGDFTAEWTGRLLVRNDTTYRFHAFVQGTVTVSLGGREVLKGVSPEPAWINGDPVDFDFGFHRLQVDFQRTAPEARIHLYWSSERFPLEPVPAHLLFHLGEDESVRLAEAGRVLFDAHRCNRCHQTEGEVLSPAAPSLSQVTTGLNPDWLVAKLRGSHPEAAHARMPDFGLSEAEASDIAEYLWHIAQDVSLETPPEPKAKRKEQLPAGETLIRSTGCLACHVLGELGQSGPFGGGDLSQIGGKRSIDWLYTQLLDPTRVNADHRMPVFTLTPTQRSIIATTLSKQGREADPQFGRSQNVKPGSDAVRRGKQLVQTLRCGACHKTPLAEPDVSQLPKLTGPIEDWKSSCLGEAAAPETGRPVYRNIDRDAVIAYLATRQGSLSPPSGFEHGQLVLHRRNCLSCHERGLATGIVPTAGKVARTDPEFSGQSQALIPPSLTAVGDKLFETALAESVVAGPSPRRRPWLQIQMPKFAHSVEEKAALTQ
ncbi:MAG: c-type cytochrome, partial [Maioricimonas sp. JB049]